MDKQQRMIDVINEEVGYTQRNLGKGHLDSRVIAAMQEVPREWFVPEELKPFAYDDSPLRIGYGQTISQPYIVAIMTDQLRLGREDVVLEIGTGSGYQAAVLSMLVSQVHTVETIEQLYVAAQQRLSSLGYNNVICHHANGYHGWPDEAPYDAIIVTAAAPYIPSDLVEQLKPGGRMIIPVGQPHLYQELMLVTKAMDGELKVDSVLGVAFVPLVDGVE